MGRCADCPISHNKPFEGGTAFNLQAHMITKRQLCKPHPTEDTELCKATLAPLYGGRIDWYVAAIKKIKSGDTKYHTVANPGVKEVNWQDEYNKKRGKVEDNEVQNLKDT